MGWIAASAIAVFVLRLVVPDATEVGVAYLYLVPVGLAAWWLGRGWSLLTAGACIGLYVLSLAFVPASQLALAIPLRSAVLLGGALVISELRERSVRLTESEIELEAYRQVLTPSAIPPLRGMEVAISFLPSEHEASGDFYLVTNGPAGTNIAVIGDVSGHGLEAARAATFARSLFAMFAPDSTDPAEILTLANRALAERWSTGERFVTAVCLVHDPAARRLRCALAGHYPPIRLGDLQDLGTSARLGLPLGIDPAASFAAHETALEPSEGVLLYTDGLIEARSGGEQFGQERLRRVLAANRAQPCAQLVASVRDALRAFGGNHFRDDVCIVALRAREA